MGTLPEDDSEDVMTLTAETPTQPESVTRNEDIWASEAEKAAKRELLERTTMVGKDAVVTGDLTAKGPVVISGVVEGNITCEDKVTVKGAVTGNIVGKSVLVADGVKVRGNITSSADLKLEAGASVEGDLTGQEIGLEGSLVGNITCSGSLTLGPGSTVTGDIATKDLTTALGARINGRVEMKG